jgi:hypothetical protein
MASFPEAMIAALAYGLFQTILLAVVALLSGSLGAERRAQLIASGPTPPQT